MLLISLDRYVTRTTLCHVQAMSWHHTSNSLLPEEVSSSTSVSMERTVDRYHSSTGDKYVVKELITRHIVKPTVDRYHSSTGDKYVVKELITRHIVKPTVDIFHSSTGDKYVVKELITRHIVKPTVDRYHSSTGDKML